jgi:hypothetical protein
MDLRVGLIVATVIGLILDGLWIANDERTSGGADRASVPRKVVERRLAEFGDGPIIAENATEGDFARAGYIWATMHRPKAPSVCPAHVAALQRGCLLWIDDARNISGFRQ